MIEIVEVVTTVATEAEAQALARGLVEERLAACANVVRCRSVYSWQGALRDEPEFQIQWKTLASAASRLEDRLREIHPYETPAILRLPVLAVDERYARWVAEMVAEVPRS